MKLTHGFAPLVLALSFASFAAGGGQTASGSESGPIAAAPPLTVEQAVNEALQSNAGIRAAVRRLSLAQLKTTTAAAWTIPC